MKQTTTITVVSEFSGRKNRRGRKPKPVFVAPVFMITGKGLLNAFNRSKDNDRNYDPNAK